MPVLKTSDVTEITQTTAISGGNITDDGGSAITARGVCWSTSINPTISDSKTEDVTGAENFTSIISDLKPNTTYYIRAFAINSLGTGYGNILKFNTLAALAQVTTLNVTEVTATSAKSGGEVTDNGGVTVTASGVVWDTNEDPTLDNNKGYTIDDNNSGTFTSLLTNLEFSTLYYVRSYATNSVGTVYGNQQIFTTLEGVTDIDGNIYSVVTIGSQKWMAENLKTTKFNDGIDIPYVSEQEIWGGLSTPAFCWWKNQSSYANVYGALYNWFAVETGKLCPSGWHVPSDEEWYNLENYVDPTINDADATGMRGTDASVKLKATSGWNTLFGSNGTDNHGFRALPGSFRHISIDFDTNYGFYGYWWSSTEMDFTAWYRHINVSNEKIGRDYYGKQFGFSIRCVKD